VFLVEPPAGQGDIRFALFGIPIRVHPFFWVMSVLLGLSLGDPIALLTWVAACFASILVHELGHALVMRSYGYYPYIVLYGMGGMAVPGLGAPHPGRNAQVAISFAGPGAGFLLAGIVCLVLKLAGPGVDIDVGWPYLIHIAPAGLIGNPTLTLFIGFLLFLSVFWGIINLLPIIPLDGGQICDEICNTVRPYDGTRIALLISCVAGCLVAVTAIVQWGSIWVGVLFGYFAYNSFLALSQGGYRRW
jgi:stage IV sporulation protein FB